MTTTTTTIIKTFLTAFAVQALASVSIDTIKVTEERDDAPLNRLKQDSVVKKETLSKKRIEHKNVMSLARAVDLEPGVQTTLTCATCGSQRVTLNGMRGENTVVLIDGIPAYSSVSSFYGMEAIPMASVGTLEIMRGAGASLIAPESIGGAINIVTERTDGNRFNYMTRGGENGSFNQQFLGSYGNSKRGVLVAAQTNEVDSFDTDGNAVSETSNQEQKSAFIKYDQKIGNRLKLSIRSGIQDLELVGGTAQDFRTSGYPTVLADEISFVGGDVRNPFIGDQSQISDLIRLERVDAGASVLYHIDGDTNVKFSSSLAKQKQRSIYSHGYDYDNDDMFRFFDLRVNRMIGEDHLLTFGIDHRNEEMNSSSEFLFSVNDFFRDSFTFDTFGAYIQDEWFITDKDEINLVLRVDQMNVEWADQRLANTQLNETVIAPRVHYKRQHTDTLSSRVSVGVGYRAPLTLFESQHGTNENGFQLNIQELETAETYSYTLNRETDTMSTAISTTLTRLHNMAYADEDSTPMLFENAQESMSIGTINLLHVQKITNNWTLESSFDWFIMPESYKRKLPIAAQETRARILSDYHFNNDKSEFVATINFIGPRNLRSYNYEKHYNVLAEDPITFDDVPSEQKNQDAPLFYTIDLSIQSAITKSLTVVAGMTNLLNFTQTDELESPLSWRVHGDHLHLDNRHIWGPTQGRVVFAGLNYSL